MGFSRLRKFRQQAAGQGGQKRSGRQHFPRLEILKLPLCKFCQCVLSALNHKIAIALHTLQVTPVSSLALVQQRGNLKGINK